MQFDCGDYKLEPIPRGYRYGKPKEIDLVQIHPEDIVFEVNHFLDLYITYWDGTDAYLLGRMTLNEIKGTWAIDAINKDGDQLALRILQ